MLKLKYILILILLPQLVLANPWQNLWLNKNQQGVALLKQNKYSEASTKFENHNWRGIAFYRAKQYTKAYAEFKHDNSASGLYNQGNSLANMHQYTQAINSYNKALKLQNNYPDAKFNKELVEKLLQQQQQNSKNKKEQQNKEQNNKNTQNDKQQQQNSENKKEQQDKQQNDKQQQQNSENKKEQQDKQQNDKQQQQNKALVTENNKNKQEQVQQIKAELSKIPDDPGGLLKNKFIRDYQRQQQEGNNQ